MPSRAVPELAVAGGITDPHPAGNRPFLWLFASRVTLAHIPRCTLPIRTPNSIWTPTAGQLRRSGSEGIACGTIGLIPSSFSASQFETRHTKRQRRASFLGAGARDIHFDDASPSCSGQRIASFAQCARITRSPLVRISQNLPATEAGRSRCHVGG